MRKVIVSIHSTLNGVVTGSADDKIYFMTWTQTGIDDSGEVFLENRDTVDTILLWPRYL